MRKTRWINRVAILGVILIMTIGGLWLWDAKNYPIPGIPDVADPFGNSFPRLAGTAINHFPIIFPRCSSGFEVKSRGACKGNGSAH